MAIIKCKMCGGDLNIIPGQTVAECEYCGTQQTVPTADSEKKLTLFSRANRLRASCDFDKAAGIYESIVVDFPTEAEAYWGLVLCKYGIEYVDDPATGKKVPTCHRSSFESVMNDTDLEQALENADVLAQRVYREEAKQIEEIRKGIISVSSNEAPYDIFICYKETAEDGGRSLDSVLAQDIYDALTDKGYRVFFSRITLEDKLGQEYEPYIFAALNSAKIMLAVGTSYEHYNAVWVKNEWSRYLKLMADDRSKHLIPCYKGIDAYDMPPEFSKLQAQDLGKIGAIQDLLRGIEKLMPQAPKKEAPARSSNYEKYVKDEYDRMQAKREAEERFKQEQEERAEVRRRLAAEQAEQERLAEEARIRQDAQFRAQQRREQYKAAKRHNRKLFRTMWILEILLSLLAGFMACFVVKTMEPGEFTTAFAQMFSFSLAMLIPVSLVFFFNGRIRFLEKLAKVGVYLVFVPMMLVCVIVILVNLKKPSMLTLTIDLFLVFLIPFICMRKSEEVEIIPYRERVTWK